MPRQILRATLAYAVKTVYDVENDYIILRGDEVLATPVKNQFLFPDMFWLCKPETTRTGGHSKSSFALIMAHRGTFVFAENFTCADYYHEIQTNEHVEDIRREL